MCLEVWGFSGAVFDECWWSHWRHPSSKQDQLGCGDHLALLGDHPRLIGGPHGAQLVWGQLRSLGLSRSFLFLFLFFVRFSFDHWMSQQNFVFLIFCFSTIFFSLFNVRKIQISACVHWTLSRSLRWFIFIFFILSCLIRVWRSLL